VPSSWRAFLVGPSPPVWSFALGVGNSDGTILDSVRCECHFRPGMYSRSCGWIPDSSISSTNSSVGVDSSRLGVGSNPEESLASMGSASVGRSYNAPSDIHPHLGKVSEDGVESKSKVPCDVLTDNDCGS
jgi:hypothetical protein